MLKIYDNSGKLRYILLDDEKTPKLAKKIAKELLEKYGIVTVDTEEQEPKREKKMTGPSQDDSKFIGEQ